MNLSEILQKFLKCEGSCAYTTKSCFLTVVLPLFCMAAYAQSTDRTVSRNCQTITPGYSFVCSGRQLEPDSNFSPTVTFICGDGITIFIQLTHEPVSFDSKMRDVTLQYNDGNNWFKLTSPWWLAPSATLSMMHTRDRSRGRGSSSDDFWVYTLLSKHLARGASVFEFSIENGGVTKGIFELDYPDAELIEQILPKCG